MAAAAVSSGEGPTAALETSAAKAMITPATAAKAMESRNAAALETGGRRSAARGWPMEPASAKAMAAA